MRSSFQSTVRYFLIATTLVLAAACSDSTEPEDGPGAGLPVELRNYSNQAYDMGLQGGTLVTVPGNPTTGSPTDYSVTNPGEGNSLSFVAQSGGTTLTATCTVTSATNVSEAPMVVVQPAFNVLDCVSW
jgi:hypothetical protein